MDSFNYREGRLYAEDVSLSQLAEEFSTPCYIYSRQTISRHWQAFETGFGQQDVLICYAVKANSNIAILQLLASMGAGFDIVSVGELERVIEAGGAPEKIVFSGVAKSVLEIRRALEIGIACFNVESLGELDRINDIAAQMDSVARVSIRVNPDVDPNTHPYISTGLKENKFGIEISEAISVYERAFGLSNIEVTGIDCHIGSQITELDPFSDALDKVVSLAESLKRRGLKIDHIDVGGGLGIRYENECPPDLEDYARLLIDKVVSKGYKLILEPGRAIMGNAGVLLTRVEFLKSNAVKNFAIVDAAMNDLLRPALYQAWHDIIPVCIDNESEKINYDLVGPVCETGDFLGKNRVLAIQPGDVLAVRSCGAYGFSMSSNYNSRCRPAEILVDGQATHVIRERENIADLMLGERLLP